MLPTALLLAVIGTGLGLEHRGWLTSAVASNGAWEPGQFSLSPLPFLGWTVFGFSLGVFLGALIRRTVAAMAATFASYALVLYNVAIPWLGWRYHYLSPLRASVQPTFSGGSNGMSYSYSSGSPGGPGSDFLSGALGWPDGRLLSPGEYSHPAAWFRLHHIQVWLTYQPAGRIGLFQLIEAGWLVAATAILIAATVVLVRRRAA